ncbi:hypothetical protein E2562_030467 [Oryza meyeriana var. granulata]|uniref:DUF834 domain-containing protein n=1 Tax=Oryza meyeriana var. granulata TaxID=110450 RepID=A0A6G1CJJ2_9ORYZ|nr:hypothetical protein E2562_030467 [Oryza meyeriana var. granulata]
MRIWTSSSSGIWMEGALGERTIGSSRVWRDWGGRAGAMGDPSGGSWHRQRPAVAERAVAGGQAGRAVREARGRHGCGGSARMAAPERSMANWRWVIDGGT